MRRPTYKAFGAVVVSLFALAACSTTSTSGGSTGNTPSGGSSSGGSASTSGNQQASGAPITIGYLVPDAGPEANPQIGPGLEASLNYINSHGGIKGRPLKALECHTDASAAKETSCANNFVQEKVAAIIDGFDRGINYSLPVYKAAKIPVIGNVAQNAVADTDTSGAYTTLGPANAVYAIAPLVAFKKAGYTKLAFGLNDIPAQHTYADKFLVPVAKGLGIQINAIYYSDTAPNFSVVAATAQSSGAQVLGVVKLATPAQCQQFITQARQVGYTGQLLAGSCVGLEQLGANSKGVWTYQNNYFPAMKKYLTGTAAEQVQEMAVATADIPTSEKGFFTYEDFATLEDFVQISSKLPAVDASTMAAALHDLKNYQAFAGPTLTCGGTAFTGTSACSNKLLLSLSDGSGGLKPVGPTSDAGFTLADQGLVPK